MSMTDTTDHFDIAQSLVSNIVFDLNETDRILAVAQIHALLAIAQTVEGASLWAAHVDE